ncbi:replication-associated recombination protein A [Phytoactinopolyspora halotolerans]|uniref:Replication-associated recombination protein A n=1 Tax=Phytoactinopolyspora halotolerans TaxID=1981512 RepID=A0A6L9S8H8_9ACTN|nr:replication-associated recombination protein A [Phytoactinopolyspora halotolerans]NEE01333.1 replication-associated recombination protein A [Phytoactinopolyspora halotolerans]
MEQEGLFGAAPAVTASGGSLAGADESYEGQPLAVRMRPRALDEVVGQEHLLGPGTPLRRLVEEDQPMALVLWGPPGTGKTTLAYVVSRATQRHFVELSAVTAGVKDVREVMERARRELVRSGTGTVLFVDEVHRFSKTQQDALLPGVENRWVSLVAATTENPYFALNSPLLSRSLLLTLEPLGPEGIETVFDRALADERGLGGAVKIDDDAREHLVRLSGGDARRALTYLEAAAGAAGATDDATITLSIAEHAVDRAAVRYDRDGDQHYDVASALIKSIRGSDVDAGLHYLARMAEAGEDPRFLARRLVILASEDIGMADPSALQTAVAAAQAVQLIGWPEAQITLAQAVIALALAPKSNSVVKAIGAAVGDVRAGLAGAVPPHLRDSHYSGSKKLGHGTSYAYAHDDPRGVVQQQYAPDSVADKQYYQPGTRGAERDYAERYARLRTIIRGE